MAKRFHCLLVPVAALLLAGAGCVTGSVLHLPGELSRPRGAPPARPAEGPVVAVLDFSYAGSPPYEIGRDFDHARSIVWKRHPGKELADLVGKVFAEQGVRAVRLPDDSALPANVSARVWGRVDELRVSTKKTGSLRLSVEVVASVSATVQATGGNAPAGWGSSLGSDYVATEPLLVTPESVRDAVSAAMNAVAEEAVKRVFSAGAVERPPAPHRSLGEEPVR